MSGKKRRKAQKRKKEDFVVLTDDAPMLRHQQGRPAVIHEIDRQILEGDVEGRELTALDFHIMGQAMSETKSDFDRVMAVYMNRARALYARRLRIDQGFSYRALAAACHAAWGGFWEPPSNQLMGMAICEAAARSLGEPIKGYPWNFYEGPSALERMRQLVEEEERRNGEGA